MAILDLHDHRSQLEWKNVSYDFDYHLTILCKGIKVFASIVQWRDGTPPGTLRSSALKPFDQAFRPLFQEEWPVEWEDRPSGQ